MENNTNTLATFLSKNFFPIMVAVLACMVALWHIATHWPEHQKMMSWIGGVWAALAILLVFIQSEAAGLSMNTTGNTPDASPYKEVLLSGNYWGSALSLLLIMVTSCAFASLAMQFTPESWIRWITAPAAFGLGIALTSGLLIQVFHIV